MPKGHFMPDNDMKTDMTLIDNALLRNNEYLIEKMTKIVKDEVSTVRNDVVSHNESVLNQVVDMAKTAGRNATRIENLEKVTAVQEEKLKGLNGKIATVGAIGSVLGGFFTFLISNLWRD